MTSRSDKRTRGAQPVLRKKPERPSSLSYSVKRNPVQIMKFGGTSVADAPCIRNVVNIISEAATANQVVVVVSAMAGVTNKLVEAGRYAEAGERRSMEAILDGIRKQHLTAVNALIAAGARRELLTRRISQLCDHCERLCEEPARMRELALRTRDALWSIGERLNAPILSAALAESGVPSEPVEATDVVVTTPHHGEADPLMDRTRENCEARLRPLMGRGIVPVTTGFIGASADGVLTTLGRGGSDYSATIIGAALDADEVIIWTDVDGVLTADPDHVRGARTIPEMSYSEAAELAHFGAKVLHPKTLRALQQCSFPLWVRSTFSPHRAGTRITPQGATKSRGVRAITSIAEVCMIRMGGPGIAKVHKGVERALAAAARVRSEVLLTSHRAPQNDACLIVSSAHLDRTLDSLRGEFAEELMQQQKVKYFQVDSKVSIVTLVGQNMPTPAATVKKILGAFGRKRVEVIASAQGPSKCNISLVVARRDLKAALTAAHREFRLEKASAPRARKRNRRS